MNRKFSFGEPNVKSFIENVEKEMRLFSDRVSARTRDNAFAELHRGLLRYYRLMGDTPYLREQEEDIRHIQAMMQQSRTMEGIVAFVYSHPRESGLSILDLAKTFASDIGKLRGFTPGAPK